MKQLTFLLDFPYNALSNYLVAYLVDAGHLVDVLASSDSPQWLARYTYNLKSVQSEQLNYVAYDYVLALDQERQHENIPTINFKIAPLSSGVIKLALILQQKQQRLKLLERELEFNNENFSELYEAMKEAFIDALVFLLRKEDQNLVLSTAATADKGSLQSLFELEQKIHLLSNYYAEAEADADAVFMLKNLSTRISSNDYKNISHKLSQLSKEEIELLLAYLLMLLNSRQVATYKYDFENEGRCLTKYLMLSPEASYSEIIAQVQHPIYKVSQQQFFTVFTQTSAEISLRINPKAPLKDKGRYHIYIDYDTETQMLSLTYAPELYFFAAAGLYIDYFCKHMPRWKNGHKNFYAILYTDLDLYQVEINAWNNTENCYPMDKTIHALFEAQVVKTPDNIALVYEDKKFTYAELNQITNRLAHYLIKQQHIQADDLIALYLERNEYMLITILAVLKAGAAYVPIEIKYPEERVLHILQDTKTRLVLSTATQQDQLTRLCQQCVQKAKTTPEIVVLDSPALHNELEQYSASNPLTLTKSSDLAYVIYTSGSTGKPKGVMIEHSGVVNLALLEQEVFTVRLLQVNEFRNYLAYASYVFDAQVFEIYTALIHGHTLYVIDDAIKADLDLVAQYIDRNKIQVATIPPVLLSKCTLLNLETLVVAGDKADAEILDRYAQKGTQVINAYGPTEATVCASLHHYQVGDLYTNIGKPITNKTVYVLDAQQNPLPVGVIGELYIGGVGIARGYLNLPLLNQERFIPNKFQALKKNATFAKYLYKSGDLVRWLPGGDLEFIGRNDAQIKIRGHRIELEEIEIRLSSYEGIKQAAVLIKEHEGNKYIAAYYVAAAKFDPVAILTYLQAYMPDYMLPSVLMHLHQLPMTVNGKLDKKALPEPEFINNDRYVSPTTPQEQIICALFSEVLGIKKVGVNDNFFHLGGDSMRAIRLTSKLQTNFDIKLADVLNLCTPKKIAQNAHFEKNFLKNKLAQVKLAYQNKQNNTTLSEYLQHKVAAYHDGCKIFHFNAKLTKPCTQVLLTGATGYLGSHLLEQLLKTTPYKVYMLVRASDHAAAYARVKHKFSYYFKEDLAFYQDRVQVYAGDLQKECLGLTATKYQDLMKHVESVIHAAAFVNHYGGEEVFHNNNVQATINLLEFVKCTREQDFHFISTSAPMYEGQVAAHEFYVFDETDDPQILVEQQNLYAKTKLAAEALTLKYRELGLKTNIYRMGNLVCTSTAGELQENSEDNAFYHWLKCLLKMQCVAPELAKVDISPVDLAASAIVKLFDKKDLANNLFHVFNPYMFDLETALLDRKNAFATLSIDRFIDNIIAYIMMTPKI